MLPAWADVNWAEMTLELGKAAELHKMKPINNQWKKEQVWTIFGCCTADSPTDKQLYNNG